MTGIQDLYRALSSQKFVLDNEKHIQSQIEKFLISADIKHNREFVLSKGNIIDFMVGDIGIEVKLKCSKRHIFRQCTRYMEHDAIKSLLLVSATFMGLPEEINGKPIYILSLTKSWL